MINLNNISAGFGNRVILNDLTLSVPEGEFVHILGANGAGKSTLFNVILGKKNLEKGTITLEGRPTHTISPKERALQIAYVAQNTSQGTIPDFTVQENMELALLRGKSAALSFRKCNVNTIIDQLSLCELGLEDRLTTQAQHLSGGQRQALSLVMALQNLPKILLLDEHTSALDPNTAKRIMGLTNTIVRNNNMTCMMITHNLQDALAYGDRIVILQNGAIAKDINTDEKAELTQHKLIDIMLEIEALSC